MSKDKRLLTDNETRQDEIDKLQRWITLNIPEHCDKVVIMLKEGTIENIRLDVDFDFRRNRKKAEEPDRIIHGKDVPLSAIKKRAEEEEKRVIDEGLEENDD